MYFLIELAIGLWSGSVAVLSDVFHTFSAVGGVLIALVARHYVSRPASQYASFGLIRAEILGALLNGLSLLIMALMIFWARCGRWIRSWCHRGRRCSPPSFISPDLWPSILS